MGSTAGCPAQTGKDDLDSQRGTRKAGKDSLDSLGGTREAGKNQESIEQSARQQGGTREAGKNHLDSLEEPAPQ